jgi:tetratricopeptide (TPR) repeat protein
LLGRYRWNLPMPPRPDLTYLDSATAEELRAAADSGTRSPEEWAALGEKYLVSGYYPEAEACYREASALRSDDAELAFKHGFALERLGLAAEANARYQGAIALGHPRSPELWYYVGRNRLRLDDADRAADDFRKAGDVPAARLEAAKLLARARRYEEASATLRKLTEEYPRSHVPTTILYRIAVERGDRNEADRLADRFDRQPERLPNPFDTDYDWMEKTRDTLGFRRKMKSATAAVGAKTAVEAAKELRDVSAIAWTPDAADHLSELLFRTGRPAEAVRVLEEAIERAGRSFQLVWRLGDAYAAAGRPADARREWERAERFGSGPDLKDLRLLLADVYEQAGEGERARAMRAAGRVPTATALLDAGRLPLAHDVLTQATKLAPESVDAWYWLGETCRAGGRAAEAKAAYERCLQLNPDHGRAARAARFVAK